MILASITPTPPAHLLVDTARDAIQLYGGDVDQLTAAAVLPHWEHYQLLTPQQVADVVGAFPQRGW